jgi:nucleotide-binding universal stress UspA family protein
LLNRFDFLKIVTNSKMKKVLITLDYNRSPHKVAQTGFLIAKTLGVGIKLLHVATDEIYFKLLDIVRIMSICNQSKISDEIQKMGVELRELSVQFLNKSKLHIGDANVHTLLKNGDSNESVLELAKQTEADVIVIIMALHSRKLLNYSYLESIKENISLNSSVPGLIISTNKETFQNEINKTVRHLDGSFSCQFN